jgi:hypothetical protein
MTNEQPTIEIERISIVTAIQGREGSVMAERVMTFGGETRAIAPVNLYVGDFDVSELPEAVQDALKAIDAQKQARIEELTKDLADKTAEWETLKTEKAALTAERDSLLEQVATLTARIDELTAIAEQPVATLSQIRVWLLQHLGVNAIKQVDAMIAAIPDELQRAIAYQQWEYANNVLRDNPFLLIIARQLNMTTEQMDEAYLEATKIV